MTKTNTSHPQHEQWLEMTQDTLAQVQGFCDDALTYVNELTAEWRKLTLEATRRATDLFRAKAQA